MVRRLQFLFNFRKVERGNFIYVKSFNLAIICTRMRVKFGINTEM